ncbi:MAG: pseudouridine synthase [Dehalococcoidia bacterium]
MPPKSSEDKDGERIQKVLARAGVASRRAVEEMIRQGRITVNGAPATIGMTVAAKNRVEVDGAALSLKAERKRYVLLYKPRGVVSTLSDPEGRPTIKQLLAGVNERVYPVGRLDFDSEGLIVCTNDGDLAESLLHPRHGVWKTYVVEVAGGIDPEVLRELSEGVELEGKKTIPAVFRIIAGGAGTTLLEVKLREGRKQQIRRMLALFDLDVVRLRRVAVGPLSDPDLQPGCWRDLKNREIQALRRAATVAAPA